MRVSYQYIRIQDNYVMVKLDNLLQESKTRPDQVIRVKNIKTDPLSKDDGAKYATLKNIKTTLSKSPLNNIKLDSSQKNVKQSKDEFNNNKYVSDSNKLKVNCINHPDRPVKNVSVKQLNAMFRSYAQENKTGDLNPCDVENRIFKDANKKQNKKEDPDSARGNLESSAETVTYESIKSFLNQHPQIFKDFVLHPIDNGYGDKKEIPAKGKEREIDVYLEYPEHVAELLGQKGLGFIIDGPTHYGVNVDSDTFSADESRSHTQDHLTRIEIVGGRKKIVKQNEKKAIELWVDKNMNKLKGLVSNGKRLKTSHEYSRSSGELRAGKVENREKNKKLTSGMLARLIQHLQAREPDPFRAPNTYTNDETSYYSDTYKKKMKLSEFLRPGNKDSRYKGKVSFERYPELWSEIVSSTPENLKAWKEKHQAKNGEKLFSKDKDGNVKLFENKESLV